MKTLLIFLFGLCIAAIAHAQQAGEPVQVYHIIQDTSASMREARNDSIFYVLGYALKLPDSTYQNLDINKMPFDRKYRILASMRAPLLVPKQ